jgi:hypothetical protein
MPASEIHHERAARLVPGACRKRPPGEGSPRVQLEKLKVGTRLLATSVENVAIHLVKAPLR